MLQANLKGKMVFFSLFLNKYYQGDSCIEYCITINTFLKYGTERVCNEIHITAFHENIPTNTNECHPCLTNVLLY